MAEGRLDNKLQGFRNRVPHLHFTLPIFLSSYVKSIYSIKYIIIYTQIYKPYNILY